MEISPDLIINALIALAVWFFKSQQDRRYKEQKEVNDQVKVNTEMAIDNRANDAASKEAFITYKKTVQGSQNKTDSILSDINAGITLLNTKVQESINVNQKQIADFKLEIEKRLK